MEFVFGSIIGVAGIAIGIIGSWKQLRGLFQRKSRLLLEGTHYAYHYTHQFNRESHTIDNRLLIGKWSFAQNAFGEIDLSVNYENDKKQYKGEVIQRDQFTYLILKGMGFDQVVFCILLGVSPPCHGVWLALNDANWITSDYWYLSGDPISETDAAQLIEKGRKNVWPVQQVKQSGFQVISED